jgi:DNA-binding winged helix-turn-helix (wHTH) protein/tetratricopeptide (TPR) repeat protein
MAMASAERFVHGGKMPGPPPKTARYRFGPFDLDPDESTLARNGIQIRLQDLPFRLLRMLVERPGEIVTREEMRLRLWPENTFVEFDNSLGVAIRKVRESLGDQAESPRYVATIPRRGYRFIAPVTIEGLQQPPPPAERIAPPTAPALSLPPPAPPVSSRSQRHYWLVAGLTLLVMSAGLVYRLRARPPVVAGLARVEVAVPVHVRRSVAVLGFRNLAGREQDAWLSPVFSEMLNTELGTHGDLRMVSGEDIERAKQELPLTEDDSLAKATLERLRVNPGADYVVLGSYTLMQADAEKRIRLDLRLQDTADGETIAEEAITGDENGLFDMAAKAGMRLRQRLGMSANTTGDSTAARVSLPANQLAARYYTDGRERLWAFDSQGARDLLLKAVAADPKFPLSHSALSEAWWHLGYVVKAKAEAQRARELASLLPQEDRLLVEGQYWRSMQNWPRTVESYQALVKLFPDSLDYGLLLATAQINTSPPHALQTLAGLRRLPPPFGNDARIDMTEASAWISQDLVKAQAAARMAISKGKAQGSHVIVARTYGFLCQLGVGVGGSMDEAMSNCELARQSAEAAGDRNAAAMMKTNLAALFYQRGEIARSTEMFRAAMKEFQQVGNADGVAAAMSDLGAGLLTAGNLKEARPFLQGSIAPYQEAGDKEGVALSLNGLGDLARQSGNLQVAETTYQQARATAEEIEDKIAIAYVFYSLGDVLVDRGELPAARAAYEKSLALRTQVGATQLAGETEVALAMLKIENGQPAEVESTLRGWKQRFHQEKETDDELAVSTALSRALLAQGRQGEALAEVESSRALAAGSQNLLVRLQYELASARVLLASDHPQAAGPGLAGVLLHARQHGLVGIELEAMLMQADLEQRSAHKALAQQQLATLERMAHDKGFALIARKAASLRT